MLFGISHLQVRKVQLVVNLPTIFAALQEATRERTYLPRRQATHVVIEIETENKTDHETIHLDHPFLHRLLLNGQSARIQITEEQSLILVSETVRLRATPRILYLVLGMLHRAGRCPTQTWLHQLAQLALDLLLHLADQGSTRGNLALVDRKHHEGQVAATTERDHRLPKK